MLADRNLYYHTGSFVLCGRLWSSHSYMFEFIHFFWQVYQVSTILSLLPPPWGVSKRRHRKSTHLLSAVGGDGWSMEEWSSGSLIPSFVLCPHVKGP